MSVFLIVAISILVLFLIVAISISSTSFSRFKELYDHLQGGNNSSHLTKIQYAMRVREEVFKNDVYVAPNEGEFSDAYDYINDTILISKNTVAQTDIASLAIISHEFGHAMQDRKNTSKFKRCLRLRRIVGVASHLISPMFLIGVVLLFFEKDLMNYIGIGLIAIALVLFFVLLAFKFSLLRVEKEASKFGLQMLKDLDILDEKELKIAKEVCDAAYMTYVGDFFKALLSWTMLTGKSSKP